MNIHPVTPINSRQNTFEPSFRAKSPAILPIVEDLFEHVDLLRQAERWYKENPPEFIVGKKPAETAYYKSIAFMKDVMGEPFLSRDLYEGVAQIPVERLKAMEPVFASKNELGVWNFDPRIVFDLDRNYSEEQIYIMSKLAKQKVKGVNLDDIIFNPELNWRCLPEKVESLRALYGKNLREVEVFENIMGEVYLSADIQLPHSKEKPDFFNFERIFARIDGDLAPVGRKGVKTNIDSFIDSMYARLEKTLGVFTAEDLDKAINQVKKAVPEASEQDILSVMQRLTQFSSYSSLNEIDKKLTAENIGSFASEYGTNLYFTYFNQYKHILSLSSNKDAKLAFLVTSSEVEDLAPLLAKKKHTSPKVVFVNLEGWDEGINLLRDDKELASVTVNVLKKALKVCAKNPDLTMEEAIGQVLNKKIENTFRSMGQKVKTVRLEAPATRPVILEQMRPIMPTKNLLKSTVEAVAKHYAKDKKGFKDLSLRIAKYYDDNLNVFSKQGLVENLKRMDAKINEFLQANNLSRENLYFLTPDTYGTSINSFEVINRMYCDIFKIPPEKHIKCVTVSDLKKYPEDSTFVVLDDICGTGASMGSFGEYMFMARGIPERRHVLFCPLMATQEGVDYMQNLIVQSAKRGNLDRVLTLDGNVKNYRTNCEDFVRFSGKYNSELADIVLGYRGHGDYGTCAVFPYMSPDNNSTLASYLTKFFTPNKECIKLRASSRNSAENMQLLSDIERETFYYDVFGTDKEHIMTNHRRVYAPTSWDKFSEAVKERVNLMLNR